MKRLLPLLLLVLLIPACTDDSLRIDGSSNEAFNASVDAISDSVAGTDLHETATKAMATILKKGGFTTSDSKVDMEALRQKLDGMNIEEVIKYAASLE